MNKMPETITAVVGQGSDKKDFQVKKGEIYNADSIKFVPGRTDNVQDISKFIFQRPSLNDCLEICVASKEMKATLKEKLCIKRTMMVNGQNVVFYVFQHFQTSDCVTAMSFGRFIAMCSGTVMLRTLGEYYNISDKRYTNVFNNSVLIKEVAPMDYMNRLAEKQGIPRTSRLYWLYLPGMENLVSMYPAEVIAICAYRALNTDRVKLSGSPVDSLRSVAGKMRAIGINLTDAGLSDKILVYYRELMECTHTTASMMAATELFKSITDLVKSVEPSTFA